jgi:hypothetical protein
VSREMVAWISKKGTVFFRKIKQAFFNMPKEDNMP